MLARPWLLALGALALAALIALIFGAQIINALVWAALSVMRWMLALLPG